MSSLLISLFLSFSAAHAEVENRDPAVSWNCFQENDEAANECFKKTYSALEAAGCRMYRSGFQSSPRGSAPEVFFSFHYASRNCTNALEEGHSVPCPAGFTLAPLKVKYAFLPAFSTTSLMDRICIRGTGAVSMLQ